VLRRSPNEWWLLRYWWCPAGLRRWGMPQNFIACDRDQELLLPPDLRSWLPENHLAWFVLAAVEEMDLYAFYRPYSADGVGRPAHEPG